MKRLGFVLRAVAGVALLVLLVARVGGQDLGRVLAEPAWGFVVLSLLWSGLLIGVSCIKWQRLLRHAGVAVGLGRLMALYVIGMLFNQFLPSNVGGDVARSVGLGRYTRQMPNAFATVFLERLTGFVALVACAWLGAAARPSLLGAPFLAAALAAATAGLAMLVWLALDARVLRVAEAILPARLAGALPRRLRSFAGALAGFRSPAVLMQALALSIAFYVLAVLNVWVTVRIFGPAPDLAALAVVVPVVLVVSLVPVSIGGIGITEWAYVVCLGETGIPAEIAAAAALFLRLKGVLLGLLGAALLAGMRWDARDAPPPPLEPGT